jgi:hypothetical protein
MCCYCLVLAWAFVAVYCPPLSSPGATSQGTCTGPTIGDGASCVQGCNAPLVRVSGSSAFNVRSWPPAPHSPPTHVHSSVFASCLCWFRRPRFPVPCMRSCVLLLWRRFAGLHPFRAHHRAPVWLCCSVLFCAVLCCSVLCSATLDPGPDSRWCANPLARPS